MKSHEKALLVLSIASLSLTVMGVNRCQEDYEFGRQSNVPTPTSTQEDDGGITTRTPTPTATDTGEAQESGTPTPTPTATETDTTGGTDATDGTDAGTAAEAVEGVIPSDIFTELAQLSEKDDAKATPHSGSAGSGTSANKAENWLGGAFSDQPSAILDSDGDGYSNKIEVDNGTDPEDPASMPDVQISTSLADRFRGIDSDLDGVSDQEERALGSNPSKADTDGDGVRDGAEIRSGTDLLKPQSRPVDADGDGLSDQYEKARGLNPAMIDSDQDGLSDSDELVYGSNPVFPDTDNDGIFDGKEVQMGSDPTKSEVLGN